MKFWQDVDWRRERILEKFLPCILGKKNPLDHLNGELKNIYEIIRLKG